MIQWEEFTEYQPRILGQDAFSKPQIDTLVAHYAKRVEIGRTLEGDLKITPQGWVGYIPLDHSCGLYIRPKVPIANIFYMLSVAYDLDALRYSNLFIQCDRVEELYENLAQLLADKVLHRCRQGLYKTYEEEEEYLPYVRGRLQIPQLFRHPHRVQLPCEYQEQTVDNKDNQILAWTLHHIIRLGFCTHPDARASVQMAYAKLKNVVSLKPIHSYECVGRNYHRLNQDYHLLHALCRMFLDLQGFTHQVGDHHTLPFLVNMAQLYERFVAAWLKKHTPRKYQVDAQETMQLGGGIRFQIDLVIRDVENGQVRCVLDTKYKKNITPGTSDVSQIISYAVSKRCTEGILIYPSTNIEDVDIQVGDIRVRTLCFPIDQDMERGGEQFLHRLLSVI